MESTQLQSYIDTIHKTVLQDIDSHIESHRKYIEGFSRHTLDFLEKLENQLQNDGNISRDTKQFIADTFPWAESLGSFVEGMPDETIWEAFDHAVGNSLNTCPKTETFEIPDSFWNGSHQDSYIVRLRKSSIRTRLTIHGYSLAVTNVLRRIIGKQPLERRKTTRTVHTRNLLESTISLPARGFVMDIWQSYLHVIAGHFYHFHELSDLIKNRLLDILSQENAHSEASFTKELREKITHVTSETLDELAAMRGNLDNTLIQILRDRADDFIKQHERVGTFMLPHKQYGTDRINTIRDHQEKSYNTVKKAWVRHLTCEYEEWRKDLDLAAIQFEASVLSLDLTVLIQTRIKDAIIPLVNDCNQSIQQVHDRIIRQFGADHTTIPEEILEESKRLARTLRYDYIPKILDTLNAENLPGAVQRFHDSMIESAEQLRDSYYMIFIKRDLNSIPPRSEMEKVPFRDLITEDILVRFTADHVELLEEISERLDTVRITATDIDQILDINIEAALNLAIEHDGKTGEDAYHVLRDGIDRSRMHIEHMTDLFREIETETAEHLARMTHDLTDRTQETADNEKVLALKIRLTQTRTRQKIQQYRKEIWRRFLAIIPVAAGYIRKTAASVRNVYRRARKISRLEPVSGRIDEKIEQYLSETNQKISSLPYVYKRLFNIDPIADRRFFAGQENELEQLGDMYRSWLTDRKTTVALVGERGSGKTSFLNIALSDCFGGHPVIRINMNNTIRDEQHLLSSLIAEFDINDVKTLEEMENRLVSSADHYVCMVENIHLLFIRTITGFDLLERLMLLMQNTRSTVFWIMSSSLYAWQYLDRAVSLSTHFRKMLYLKTQGQEQMSTIIMKRHRMSGYRIVYETPPELQRNRRFKKLKKDRDRQAFIEQELFRDLANVSAGNIRVAMLFWLTAIKKIDREQLVISTKIEFNPAFIYQLPDEELFTLAAFIQHEIMDAEEHALIFNQDLMHSQLLLDSLFTRGLLQQQPNGYYVHPFLYRPIVEALRSKQMLQ